MKKNGLMTSIAAFAVAGSMVSATPAYAADPIFRDVIREGSRIYRDQQRNELQRERNELQREREQMRLQQQRDRLEAQRERDYNRSLERHDSQANTRCNQSERNQLTARGQDYKYTKSAPGYRDCAPRVGAYGAPTQGSGRSDGKMYDREAEFRRDEENRQPSGRSTFSGAASANCDVITLRGTESLRCTEADGRVTVSPMASGPSR